MDNNSKVGEELLNLFLKNIKEDLDQIQLNSTFSVDKDLYVEMILNKWENKLVQRCIEAVNTNNELKVFEDSEIRNKLLIIVDVITRNFKDSFQ